MRDAYEQLKIPGQRVHVRDASMLRRFGAFVTDVLLLDIVAFTAFTPLLPKLDARTVLAGASSLSDAAYAAIIVMALLGLAYFAFFEYLLGQTPGMMLFRITAENVTLWRAFVRNAYLLPLFPFPLLWIIEPLHLAFTKRRFLEVASNTRTIETITY